MFFIDRLFPFFFSLSKGGVGWGGRGDEPNSISLTLVLGRSDEKLISLNIFYRNLPVYHSLKTSEI